jgi:hypothetical protein
MIVKLKSKNQYQAEVYADGAFVGTANDCDGVWVLTDAPDDSVWSGSFLAHSMADFAYSIAMVVGGVHGVFLNDKQVFGPAASVQQVADVMDAFIKVLETPKGDT